MNLNGVLKKRMDEYVFIELKEPLVLGNNRGEIPADLPLPVRTKTMAGWVKEDIGTEIQLDHLAEDLAMVMGIDETFPHFNDYHEILEALTGGKIKAAVEQFASMRYEEGAPEDAMILMRTLRFLYPKDEAVRFSYALSLELFAQKRLKEGVRHACDFLYEIAAKEYSDLLEDQPAYFPAMYKLGYYYLYINQHQAARNQFQEFLNRADSEEAYVEMKQEVVETLRQIEPYCLYEEAFAYSQAQQYEEAIVLLEQVLERSDEWWQAELLLGISLRGANRVAEAIQHLQRAAVLKEQEPMISFEIAQTYYLLGRYEEAMLAIQETIGLEREWVDCYLIRAQINMAMEQPKEALKDLRICLQFEPNHSVALQLMAQMEQDS